MVVRRDCVTMTEDRRDADGGDPAEEEMSEAEIDANLAGTFPASDPPSWTLGTDHRESPPVETEEG